MSRIGISINGVLRDFFGQVEKTHQKYFPPNEGEDGIKVMDYDLDKWVVFPKETSEQMELEFNPDFDPFDSKSRDTIEDIELTETEHEVTLDEFLYERCTFEIFGSADEQVSNAITTLNNLVLEYPEHDFVLISREIGLSVPSTYFFLSKTSCMVREVKFVSDSTHSWDYVDVMVTDHPDVINSKPTDKICVMVEKEFNKELSNDYTIKTIKELSEVLKTIH